MASITDILDGDQISASNEVINTNFDNLNSDKIETSYLDTDTTLAANSDSKIATQKAVKAYVLANVNPTGPSWNEYAADAGATDAYVITLSAVTSYTTGATFKFKANTANTGACTLNVNGLGAKTIKKDVSTDLATGDILANQDVVVVYDGTNMQMVSQPSGTKDASQLTGVVPAASLTNVPFPVQDIPFYVGTSNFSEAHVNSNTDGSIVIVSVVISGVIYGNRLVKDTITGNYTQTHTMVSIASDSSYAGAGYSVVIAGSYVYVFYVNTGAAEKCYRFDLATLANSQAMTVSGTFRKLYGFGDGTDVYLQNTATTYDKFTISGTTITNASTVTFTSMVNGYNTCNGTNVWNFEDDTSIRKYALAGGAVVSTTTLKTPKYLAYPESKLPTIFIGATNALGLGWIFDWNGAGATSLKIGTGVHLMAITLP